MTSMRPSGNWMSTDLVDMLGRSFQVGDQCVKAYTSGRSVNLQICTITRIEDNKMYADNSKVKINFPGWLLIINEVINTQNHDSRK